jgi:predicted kinase
MPTMAQDVAALKKAVKELRDRVDALEGGAGLDGVRQEIRELRSDHDAMFKILLRQREDDRALADQRHAQIMGQFEKLFSQPPEN